MKKSLISLLAVVFLVPSVSSASTLSQGQINAIIGLLQAFNVSQSIITAVQNDLEPQSVVSPATTSTTSNIPTSTTTTAPVVSDVGTMPTPAPAPQFIQTPVVMSVVQTTQYDSYGRIAGGYPAYTVGWTTNIPATAEIRRLYYSTNNLGGEVIDSKYYQGELGASAPLDTVIATTTSVSYTLPPYSVIRDLVVILNANDKKAVWVGKLY